MVQQFREVINYALFSISFPWQGVQLTSVRKKKQCMLHICSSLSTSGSFALSIGKFSSLKSYCITHMCIDCELIRKQVFCDANLQTTVLQTSLFYLLTSTPTAFVQINHVSQHVILMLLYGKGNESRFKKLKKDLEGKSMSNLIHRSDDINCNGGVKTWPFGEIDWFYPAVMHCICHERL